MPAVQDRADAVAYDRRLARRYLDDAMASPGVRARFGRGAPRPGDRLLVARNIAARAEARMASVSRRLVGRADDGVRLSRGDVAAWSAAMRRQVAGSHLAAARALLPGRPTAQDRRRLDAEVRRQYGFLDGFIDKVRSGDLTGPQIVANARLYGAAAWGSAQEVLRGRMADDGMDEERAVMAVTEHCPSCIDRAEQGWQPIGTLPRMGDSECRARCQCTWTFRRSRP